MTSSQSAPRSPGKLLTCWIVTDGKIGTENQCIGLANALGLTPAIKRIKLRWPWRLFTPYLRGLERFAFSRNGDQLNEPWPDILIGSGRRSLPAAFAARKAKGDKIAIIQLQHPHCDLKNFDLVITPAHDGLTGPNVLTTQGGIHKLTPAVIERAADAQRERFAKFPQPLVAVVLGGKSTTYDFDANQMRALIEQFNTLLQSFAGTLIITASRRTGEENLKLLQDAFIGHPRVWIWDNSGDNPYPGMLGLPDWILVSEDSTGMVSEAAVSGKPVYVIKLTGGSPRFDRFHQLLQDAGITRPFTGTLETWHYSPLVETQRASQAVRKLLVQKFGVSH